MSGCSLGAGSLDLGPNPKKYNDMKAHFQHGILRDLQKTRLRDELTKLGIDNALDGVVDSDASDIELFTKIPAIL